MQQMEKYTFTKTLKILMVAYSVVVFSVFDILLTDR